MSSPEWEAWERQLLDWLTDNPPPNAGDTTGVASCALLAVEYVTGASEFMHSARIGGTVWKAEGMARYLLRCAKAANLPDDDDS